MVSAVKFVATMYLSCERRVHQQNQRTTAETLHGMHGVMRYCRALSELQ